MFLRIAIFLALFAGVTLAADIDGAWSGTVTTPNGTFTVSFIFKSDGTKLTGSMADSSGNPARISKGKVEGNRVSFSVPLKGTPVILDCAGVVANGELTLAADLDGDTVTFAVKKEFALIQVSPQFHA